VAFSRTLLTGVLLTSAAFGGGLPCKVFPAAIFSPDGHWVYYIELDIKGSYHTPSLFAQLRSFPESPSAMERIDREIVTIHRVDLGSRRDEVFKVIAAPPWLGIKYPTTNGVCSAQQQAKLWWDADGELAYEIYGPGMHGGQDWRKAWHNDDVVAFRSAEPHWEKAIGITIPLSGPGRVWENLEIVPVGGVAAAWWLLDHQKREVHVLLAGSDSDRRHASGFTYDQILPASWRQ